VIDNDSPVIKEPTNVREFPVGDMSIGLPVFVQTKTPSDADHHDVIEPLPQSNSVC
jgi:hypothetical protein